MHEDLIRLAPFTHFDRYEFGWPAYRVGQAWFWADLHVEIESNPRPCPHCGQQRPPSGHDPCIADLPNVRAACCGHGRSGIVPYVYVENGPRLAGVHALAWFASLGKGPRS